MGSTAGQPRVRLAELVAALSLGVDLGFGQPMEHVLRQCLIALRLAGHAGLGEQDRMAVYYTALLVNVGCHADAHEQAKWRSEEHTSELQSRENLVCRLLLEKKKKKRLHSQCNKKHDRQNQS